MSNKQIYIGKVNVLGPSGSTVGSISGQSGSLVITGYSGVTGPTGQHGETGPAGVNGISGGLTLFLDSTNQTYTATTLSGTLNEIPNTGTQTTITSGNHSNTTLTLASFTTPVNGLKSTSILGGLWSMNLYALSSQTAGSNVKYFFNVSYVDSTGNNPVSIATGTNASATPILSQNIYTYDLYVPNTTLPDLTYRIKIDVLVVFTGNNKNATLEFRNGTLSHIHTTILSNLFGPTGPTGRDGSIGPTGPTGFISINGAGWSDYVYWNSTTSSWATDSTKVHIGRNAGLTTQGIQTVAIGNNAGISNQQQYAVAIGANAGQNQGELTVAIGYQAGQTGQGGGAIAIGQNAASFGQLYNAVAIGGEAGGTNQQTWAIAIGNRAGLTGQTTASIALGREAGRDGQLQSAIAIGNQAGYNTQGFQAVAIGNGAGYNTQGNYSVAIGSGAGYTGQKTNTVAIGSNAGNNNQQEYSVAIGNEAGKSNQADRTVAIGSSAGGSGQKQYAVAIGVGAGGTNQGQYSVAIGAGAGGTNQPDNSIVINATSQIDLNGVTGGLCVKPIRGNTGPYNLYYDSGTGEITYANGGIGPTGPTGRDGGIGPTGPTGKDGAVGPKGDQALNMIQYDFSDNDFSRTKKVTNKSLTSNYLLTNSDITGNFTTLPNNDVTYTFGPSRKVERYIAGAVKGSGTDTLFYSEDGNNWNSIPGTTGIFTTECNDVAYNGTMWVAVGTGTNTIAYSYDGIKWTAAVGGFLNTGRFVKWNGIRWVATGYDASGNETRRIAWSDDGVNWTKVVPPDHPGNYGFFVRIGQVEWNGRVWAIACALRNPVDDNYMLNIILSGDGKNWYYPSLSNSPFSISKIGSVGIDFSRILLKWNGYVFMLVPGYYDFNSFGDIPLRFGFYYPYKNEFSYTQPSIRNNATSVLAFITLNWIDNVWFLGGKEVEVDDSTGIYTATLKYYYRLWTSPSIMGYGVFSVVDYKEFTTTNVVGLTTDGTGTDKAIHCSFYDGKHLFLSDNKGNIAKSANNNYMDNIGFISVGNISSKASYVTTIAYSGNVREHSITIKRKIWVAGGEGTNTLAYSYDGFRWIGLGASVIDWICYAVAYNGSIWVAGGQGTTILAYSYDGISWLSAPTSTTFINVRGIASNGSMWVAVGYGIENSIAYSYDGISWVAAPSGNSIFSSTGLGVAWNGSMWVATGRGTNTLAYSYDGINWVPSANNLFSYGYGVAWNDMMWVAVGEGTNSIAYSYDGINWLVAATGKNIFSAEGRRVAWNGSMWVAVGQGISSLAYSYDGIAWVAAPSGNSIFSNAGRGISWNGRMWVATGYGTNTLAYSNDGINWVGLGASTFLSYGNDITSSYTPQPIVKFNSKMVAVGTGTNSIVYSYDGISWLVSNNKPFSTGGYGVDWNGSMWVAVGQGTNTLACSYDGISWTGLGVSMFSTSGNGVTWNGSMWVAVGTGTNEIVYSYDGIKWNPVTGASASLFITGYSVIWNGSMWVAVGTGTNEIVYSYDGINWNPVTGTNANLFTIGYGVAWNGSMWVACGEGANTIAYSYNGINWTGATGTSASIFSTAGRGVAWNGSMWVATGSGTNSLAYSYDGINWLPATNNPFSSGGQRVAWNGSMWVATGQGTNTLSCSYDGINWTGLGTSSFSTAGIGIAGYINAIPLRKGEKLTICGPESYDSALNHDVNFSFDLKETTLIPETPDTRFYYPKNIYSFVRNTAISAIIPIVKGKPIKYYKVSPALPGITLNTTTGVISGTPTNAAVDATDYTITGYSGSGSFIFVLNITIT